MQILRKGDLQATDRRVVTPAYETTRFLLASDGIGVTVTDVVLTPGVEKTYGNADRTEIAYCLEGEAKLTDLATGATHAISPGTMWIAGPGETFRFVAAAPTRLICVFTPAFAGGETWLAADMASSSE